MKCSTKEIRERLIKKARTSPCRYKMAAAGLDRHGTVISMSTNLPRFHKKGGSIHAEQAVMIKSPPSLYRILIVRLGKSDELRPIEACPVCAEKAAELGIKIEPIK